MTVITFGAVTLSRVAPPVIDHAPVTNKKRLVGGGTSVQGSATPTWRREFSCNAYSRAEIDALDALLGQKLTLTIDGTEFPNCMIDAPFWHQEPLMPATSTDWYYTIAFVQETI